jgi:hypothetical protein
MRLALADTTISRQGAAVGGPSMVPRTADLHAVRTLRSGSRPVADRDDLRARGRDVNLDRGN